jgi:hypothetical protein
MKLTLLSVLFSAGFLIGQSHAQDTKRIPASVHDVEASESDSFACGLKGSIEKRIQDCSEQREGFILVTRTQEGKEVHKEVSTGLLWSDRLPLRMNHYSAEKACKADLKEVGGISGVTWRLPSIEEYEEAEKNGMRNALPNMNHWFWSSSVLSYYSNYAWLFNGSSGSTDYVSYSRNNYGSVRCVAR